MSCDNHNSLLFIDNALSKKQKNYIIHLPFSDGKTLAWLYEKGAVLSTKEKEDCIELEVSLSDKDYALLTKNIDNILEIN